ncbi:hypothetical protein SLS63_007021 [Diaporthe eres]|uniref:BTB domain-containing protein n=1 Tax=Diaporthe eres TaxID=83184 RepID=A0ABR1P6J6_DIAER
MKYPGMIQMILEFIYLGETQRLCSTPTEIIEIWKTADFFGIHDIAHEAQDAMGRRLKASREFLNFNPDPESNPQPDNACEATTVVYDPCGHSVRERRACAVRCVRPISVFHLCEPGPTHLDRMCGPCQLRKGDFSSRRPPTQQPDQPQQDPGTGLALYPTPAPPPAHPDPERREMIENEIRVLCEALAFATAEAPRIKRRLVHHICNTRVAAWGGFTVCRFLEA